MFRINETPTRSVVAVGKHLKTFRDKNASWETVRKYLDECVYAVAEDDLENPAGPGPYR